MTISEAYKKWSEEEDNRHFAIKTKAAFQQVWVNMDQSVDVTLVTLDMIRRAINRKAIRPDQASAASVMVHVLNYGRQQMGKKKPVPFEYNQILKSDEDTTRSAVPTTVSPKTTEATQPHKPEHASAPVVAPVEQQSQSVESNHSETSKPSDGALSARKGYGRGGHPIVKVHAKTLRPVKTFQTRTEAQEECGRCSSVLYRAMERNRPIDGYYYVNEEDLANFNLDVIPAKKKSKAKKSKSKAKPKKAQPKPAAVEPVETPPAVSEHVEEPPKVVLSDGPTVRVTFSFKDVAVEDIFEELRRRDWHGSLTQKKGYITITADL